MTVGTDLVVSRLSGAVELLSQAKTAQDAKKVGDLARAAEIFAQRQKLGDEAEAWARTIRLQAERLLGEFLAKAPKATGAKGIGKKSAVESIDHTPTLRELGITKDESASAQKLAAMPAEEFEKLKEAKPTRRKRKPKIESSLDELILISWESHCESLCDFIGDVLSERCAGLLLATRNAIWKRSAGIIRRLKTLEPKGEA